MISFEQRYESLVKLGLQLDDFCRNYHNPELYPHWTKYIRDQHIYQPWFIEGFVLNSFQNWAMRLSEDSLKQMVKRYDLQNRVSEELKIAVVPEENIPLAGLHDLICVLLSGQQFYAKTSVLPMDLLKFVTDMLVTIQPEFNSCIHWVAAFPKDTDAFLVYARTEKDSVLQSYFEKKKSLIRKKRFSLGIITGLEEASELNSFGKDIFTYFGLSNHSIRHLLIPENYSLPVFIQAMEDFSFVYQYNRYANNYDYHRNLFLMEAIPFLDNGFSIWRECTELHVPVGCIYYQYYRSREEMKEKMASMNDHLQTVVTSSDMVPDCILPGVAHTYPLWEYDDRKDVMEFLLHIRKT